MSQSANLWYSCRPTFRTGESGKMSPSRLTIKQRDVPRVCSSTARTLCLGRLYGLTNRTAMATLGFGGVGGGRREIAIPKYPWIFFFVCCKKKRSMDLPVQLKWRNHFFRLIGEIYFVLRTYSNRTCRFYLSYITTNWTVTWNKTALFRIFEFIFP